MGVALCLSVASTMTAFAGWEQTGASWKYKDDTTGTYLTGWQWLDGNKDNIAECYYLDSTGVMVSNTVIEGYTVNTDGAWTVNGVVQTQAPSNNDDSWMQYLTPEERAREEAEKANVAERVGPEQHEAAHLTPEEKAEAQERILDPEFQMGGM